MPCAAGAGGGGEAGRGRGEATVGGCDTRRFDSNRALRSYIRSRAHGERRQLPRRGLLARPRVVEHARALVLAGSLRRRWQWRQSWSRHLRRRRALRLVRRRRWLVQVMRQWMHCWREWELLRRRLGKRLVLRPRLVLLVVSLRVDDSTCARRGRGTVAGREVASWRDVAGCARSGRAHARGALRLAQNRGHDRWDRLRLVSAEVAARALVATFRLVQVGVAVSATAAAPVVHRGVLKRPVERRARRSRSTVRLKLLAREKSS